MIEARAPAFLRTKVSEPVRVNAPLFRKLVEHLDVERRCVVLDLGAARTETVALLSRYRCRLDIADLRDTVDRLNTESDRDRLYADAEAMLPAPHGEAADAVLCWDLLNYLERPALSALMSRVAARARPGTLVHALFYYSEAKMPSRPGSIVPHQEQSLLDLAPHDRERNAPSYAPYDLTSCMKGYSLERAMLLSNGMQEMLFRL